MPSFASQLKAFEDKTEVKIDATVTEIIIGVGASLVNYSPVGDPKLWASKPPKGYIGGRFKANWIGSQNAIKYLTTDDIDPTGEISMTSIVGAIPENPAGGVFYITNSLPYGQVLEDGSHSKQVPPGGMVGRTIIDFQAIVGQSVLKVAR